LLIEDAFPAEIQAMPESPLLDTDRWERGFLDWLASWVHLELDEDWLGEPHGTGGHDGESARFAKAREMIKNAAVLYRYRGTPLGLRRMIQDCCDCEVEIVERSWPAAMEIGCSSTIGVDSRLMDPPAFDHQFTVLIRRRPAEVGFRPGRGESVRCRLAGQAEGRQIETFLGDRGAQPAGTPPADHASATAALNRLRRVIEREKPAHTRFYLGFATEGPEAAPADRTTLRIGLESVIGEFRIF
jgi:phage tail-like protein